jgi:hypothetical protein
MNYCIADTTGGIFSNLACTDTDIKNVHEGKKLPPPPPPPPPLIRIIIIIIIIIILVFLKNEHTGSLVTSATCIWEIRGSNVGRNTAYLTENFSIFLLVVQMKAGTFF